MVHGKQQIVEISRHRDHRVEFVEKREYRLAGFGRICFPKVCLYFGFDVVERMGGGEMEVAPNFGADSGRSVALCRDGWEGRRRAVRTYGARLII